MRTLLSFGIAGFHSNSELGKVYLTKLPYNFLLDMVNQPFPNHVWSFIIYFNLICQYPLTSAQDEGKKCISMYVKIEIFI